MPKKGQPVDGSNVSLETDIQSEREASFSLSQVPTRGPLEPYPHPLPIELLSLHQDPQDGKPAVTWKRVHLRGTTNVLLRLAAVGKSKFAVSPKNA